MGDRTCPAARNCMTSAVLSTPPPSSTTTGSGDADILLPEEIGDSLCFVSQLGDGGVQLASSEIIVFDSLDNAPFLAVTGQREAADEARIDAVAAVAADRGAEARSRRCG